MVGRYEEPTRQDSWSPTTRILIIVGLSVLGIGAIAGITVGIVMACGGFSSSSASGPFSASGRGSNLPPHFRARGAGAPVAPSGFGGLPFTITTGGRGSAPGRVSSFRMPMPRAADGETSEEMMRERGALRQDLNSFPPRFKRLEVSNAGDDPQTVHPEEQPPQTSAYDSVFAQTGLMGIVQDHLYGDSKMLPDENSPFAKLMFMVERDGVAPFLLSSESYATQQANSIASSSSGEQAPSTSSSGTLGAFRDTFLSSTARDDGPPLESVPTTNTAATELLTRVMSGTPTAVIDQLLFFVRQENELFRRMGTMTKTGLQEMREIGKQRPSPWHVIAKTTVITPATDENTVDLTDRFTGLFNPREELTLEETLCRVKEHFSKRHHDGPDGRPAVFGAGEPHLLTSYVEKVTPGAHEEGGSPADINLVFRGLRFVSHSLKLNLSFLFDVLPPEEATEETNAGAAGKGLRLRQIDVSWDHPDESLDLITLKKKN